MYDKISDYLLASETAELSVKPIRDGNDNRILKAVVAGGPGGSFSGGSHSEQETPSALVQALDEVEAQMP